MEKNKTGKYFKYAIGEIILVVVGILIALQINNWNENKKDNQELKQYLSTIKTNIEDDLIVLDSLKSKRELISENCKKERFMFLNKTFDFETTVYGASAFLDFYFVANSSGYESLINSSYLGKINNKPMKKVLAEYFIQVEYIAQIEKNTNEYIETLEAEFQSNNDRSIVMAFYFMDRQELMTTKITQVEIEESFKAMYNDPSYRNIVSQLANNSNTIIEAYDNLKKVGLEVIKEINQITN